MIRLLIAVALMAFVSLPAMATVGGSHLCSDASGTYRIDFGEGRGGMKAVGVNNVERDMRFKTKSRLLLKDIQSFCVSQGCGRRFPIHAREYLLKVDVEGRGEITLYCEDFWNSSLPSCDCDHEETIKRFSIGTWQAEGNASSLWNHNGSM